MRLNLTQFLVRVAAPVLLIFGWMNVARFPPWVSWHNEVWVFAAVIIAAIGGLVNLKIMHRTIVVTTGGAWVGGLILGVICTQYAMGDIVFFGDALVIGFYVFVSWLAFVLGHQANANTFRPLQSTTSAYSSVEYFAAVIALGATLSAGIALAQVFQVAHGVPWIASIPYERRPGGNLGQPNHLATFLLMGLVSLLYLFESRRLQALSTSFAAVLLACGFAVTESRTGLLSLSLLLIWWFRRHKELTFRIKPATVFFAGTALILLFWFWPPLFTLFNAGGLPSSAIGQVNTSGTLRLVVWPQLLDAVWQRPWFGWGLGQISKAHSTVLHSYILSEPYTYAHNIFLDIAVGVGLPFTALALSATAVWLWRRVHVARSLIPWYCLAVALPFAVHALLEFPFAYSYLLFPTMFIVGVLESFSKEQQPNFHLPQSFGIVAMVIATSVMAWSAWEYVLIEEDFRIARFESMSVGTTASEYQRPKIYMLTQLDALVHAVRIKPTPDMSNQKLDLLREVARRYPDPLLQNRYALALALNECPNEAIAVLQLIKAMHFEKVYASIRQRWLILGETDYPQLKNLAVP